MSEFFNRTDPAPLPMSEREKKRWLRLKVWVWGKEFGSRLKANAVRMKQFLHGAGRK